MLQVNKFLNFNYTHYVTAETFTLTVTANKAIAITGLPTVALTNGAFTRQATYNPITSTTTVLKFDYTFVSADVAAASIPIANLIVPQSGYGITMAIDSVSSEIVPDANLTYTAIADSGVTVN